jgi:hypothetical protein
VNLEKFAVLRGEAWARRIHRQKLALSGPIEQPWPGSIEEARELADQLGRPELTELLATIIQERASMAWRSLAEPAAGT